MNALLRAVALLNLLVLAVHGWAHARLPVPLTTAQTLIVYGTIVPGASAAFALSWRWPKGAAVILLLSSAIALPFGVLHHFVWVSPDHVRQVPAGAVGATFRVSAVLLAVSEAMGVLVAFAKLQRRSLTRA